MDFSGDSALVVESNPNLSSKYPDLVGDALNAFEFLMSTSGSSAAYLASFWHEQFEHRFLFELLFLINFDVKLDSFLMCRSRLCVIKSVALESAEFKCNTGITQGSAFLFL